MKSNSGSVLAQVLIMSLLMAVLAAGLVRMAMNQYMVAVNTRRNESARQCVTAANNAVASFWSVSGGGFCYASGGAVPNLTDGSGTGTGVCNCSYTYACGQPPSAVTTINLAAVTGPTTNCPGLPVGPCSICAWVDDKSF